MVLNIFPRRPAAPAQPAAEQPEALPEPSAEAVAEAEAPAPARARRGTRGGTGRGRAAAATETTGDETAAPESAAEADADDKPAPAPRRSRARAAAAPAEVAVEPAVEEAVGETPVEAIVEAIAETIEDATDEAGEEPGRPRRRRGGRGRGGSGGAAAAAASESQDDDDGAPAPSSGRGAQTGGSEFVMLTRAVERLTRQLEQQGRQMEQLAKAQEDTGRRGPAASSGASAGSAGKGPRSLRVGIFVDVANVELASDRMRARFDWGKILGMLTDGRELVRAIAYSPVHDDPQVSIETQRFVEPFLDKGYKIVTKPLKRFQDGTIKANVDIELALDVISMLDRLDIVCLVSGDGDFQHLVEVVQSRGVRVEVVSVGASTATNLKNAADAFIDLAVRIRDIRA